ncbi:hypothetical protein CSAL01_09864 [Colletotrichum salicis]|uniref:Uncharacterized protein n=1 Tax=Colletotrichum salicis TaxID=1209931 RepID=A0A135U0Q3_9PEZI|nr:hypothetical protein CSAL01_09864 [Colletotrichum salicis]
MQCIWLVRWLRSHVPQDTGSADLTDRITVDAVNVQWGRRKATTKLNRAVKKYAIRDHHGQTPPRRTFVCQPYLIGMLQGRPPICATESDINLPDRRSTPPIPSGTGP